MVCKQEVTLAGCQQLPPQGPMPVQAHCTEGRTRSKGREGASGEGTVEDRNEDGNGDGDGGGDGNEDGDGGGDGNEDGNENEGSRETGAEMGAGAETRSGADTGTGTRRGRLLLLLLLFLTFSVLVANPEKQRYYTVANLARGLSNRERRIKRESHSLAAPPPPPPRAGRY